MKLIQLHSLNRHAEHAVRIPTWSVGNMLRKLCSKDKSLYHKFSGWLSPVVVLVSNVIQLTDVSVFSKFSLQM